MEKEGSESPFHRWVLPIARQGAKSVTLLLQVFTGNVRRHILHLAKVQLSHGGRTQSQCHDVDIIDTRQVRQARQRVRFNLLKSSEKT